MTTFVASDGSTRTVTVLIDGPETVETVRAAVELQPEPEPEPKEPPAVDDPPQSVAEESPTEVAAPVDPPIEAGVGMPPGTRVIVDLVEVMLNVLAERPRSEPTQ